jgi:adenylate kinase
MGSRLVVFGYPGVGKGTHSRRLARELGIPHVATGDMLRAAIAADSLLGQQAARHMNGGNLVPDEVAVALLADRLAQPDAAEGYLLDGFPRTVPQAEALVTQLSAGTPGVVLSLEAPEALLVERLVGRQTCPGCGATFNRASGGPRQADRCDACGSTLVVRPDDQEPTVRRRLAVHQAKTAPVLSYLGTQGWPIRHVSSVGEVDEVYGRIRAAAGADGTDPLARQPARAARA